MVMLVVTSVLAVAALLPGAKASASCAPGVNPGLKAHCQEGAEYRIRPKDELDIRVEGACIYGTRFEVDERGLIDVPFAGEVLAAGRTVTELASVLTRELEKYVKDPRVRVRLIEGRT